MKTEYVSVKFTQGSSNKTSNVTLEHYSEEGRETLTIQTATDVVQGSIGQIDYENGLESVCYPLIEKHFNIPKGRLASAGGSMGGGGIMCKWRIRT